MDAARGESRRLPPVQVTILGSAGEADGEQDGRKERREMKLDFRDYQPGVAEDSRIGIAMRRNTVAESTVRSALQTAEAWETPAYIGKEGETPQHAPGPITVRRTRQPVLLATIYPGGLVELEPGAYRFRE